MLILASCCFIVIFKTSSGYCKKVTMSYDQTRRCRDVWKKTSDLGRLEDVIFTSSRRRPICDVLRTSDLRRLEDVSDFHRLEDVQFTTSSRRLIYSVLRTSDFQHLEGVWFASSWRRPIYNVFETSVKQRLCSNVIVTSIQL